MRSAVRHSFLLKTCILFPAVISMRSGIFAPIQGISGFDTGLEAEKNGLLGYGYCRNKNPRIWSLHDIAILGEEER